MSRDMRMLSMPELAPIVAEQPYPLLFATVSGAHLYGFPSVDSDVDLRGVHLLPRSSAFAPARRPWTGCGTGTAPKSTWSLMMR